MLGEDGEDAISIPGPQGAAGATGSQGIQGLLGGLGLPGEDGEDSFLPGPIGNTGPQGIQGIQGLLGPVGAPGAQGDDGEDSFIPGPRGYTGITGNQGFPGLPGEDGEDSFLPGPLGNTGPQGIQGIQGVAGLSTGANIVAVRCYSSAGQTIATSAQTAVLFDTNDFDTNSMHSVSVNTTRLTCNATGTYLIEGQVALGSVTLGSVILYVKLNGTTFLCQSSTYPGGVNVNQINTIWNLVQGDYVELIVFQATGGNVALNGGDALTWFAMSQLAAQGIQGLQGIQGDQGDEGEPSFIPGPTGLTGRTGPQGMFGLAGEDGEDSFIPGPIGNTGAQGATGNTGSTGSQGLQGQQGAFGLSGEDGEDSFFPGPIGNTGPQGSTGNTGSTGAVGSQGAQGAFGLSGEDGEDSILPGPIGPAGATGATGGATLLYSNTTVPAGNTITSTSETAFASSYTIPAGSLVAGDVVRVKMHGVYSGTVLPTIRAKAKWGSTVMLDTAALSGLVTGTNLGWWAEMEFVVQTIGASGAVESQGYAEFSTAATTGLSVNPINAAAITIDTTSAQAITGTVQWGAGGTGQTITLRQLAVEKVSSSGSPGSGTVTNNSSPKTTITIGNPTSTPTYDITQAKEDTECGVKNMSIVCSVSASALTIAVKTDAGADATTTDEIPLTFRSPTAATGSRVHRALQAALSTVISSGSTMGFTNATSGRLWVVIFDNSGTLLLGAVNCLSGSNIYPLRDDILASSTAEGGAGAADSAQVIYTSSAVTSKAMRILGYLDWSSGLAAAGTWNIAPTKPQLFGAGVSLPGTPVQSAISMTGTLATGTGTFTDDNSTPQNTGGTQFMSQAITPTSAANILRIDTLSVLSLATTAAGPIITALFQDSTAGALKTDVQGNVSSGSFFKTIIHHEMLAATTSATTFKSRSGGSSATTIAFNGESGANARFNGTLGSYLKVEEIMS